MRRYLFLALLLTTGCADADGLKVSPVDDDRLSRILSLAQITDLNRVETPFDKKLWVKVYEVPRYEKTQDCFPESHGICKYDYYISTVQLDDAPRFRTYHLPAVGEIVGYEWEKTDASDTAKIVMTVTQFSSQALSYNSDLDSKKRRYMLSADDEDIEITPME